MEKEKTREHLKQREEQIASIFEKAKSELKKAQRELSWYGPSNEPDRIERAIQQLVIDNKAETEIKVKIECNLTLEGLQGVVKDLREIEKEYNCKCTLIEVKLIDLRTLRGNKEG